MRPHSYLFWGRVVLHRLRLLVPIAFALLSNPQTIAQGTVRFSTLGPGVNAPVIYLGDNTLADCRFVAQLFGAPAGNAPNPLGTPVPFLCDANRGYILDGGVIEIPGVSPGMPATIAVIAWSISSGATLSEAMQNCGSLGGSLWFDVNTGGGDLPPALLTGLTAFEINPPLASCPEPTTATLVCIGATLLALRSSDRLKRCCG